MKTTLGSAVYRPYQNGRFKIARSDMVGFEAEHPDRVLDTHLWGRLAMVLLLDQPLKVGARIQDSDVVEISLRRIRLHELPGWPPKMVSWANARGVPALMECRLREAVLARGHGPGQDALELRLSHGGRTYTARLVGCPGPLLRCAEATLNQEGVAGRELAQIQDVNLIGDE